MPGAVQEITGGGAHLSIDCIALQSTVTQSVQSLRRAGRHVQTALTTKEYAGTLAVPADLIDLFELQFLGCSATSHSRYPELLGLVAAGRLRPADLVTKQISLDEVTASMQALDDFATVGCHVITSYA